MNCSLKKMNKNLMHCVVFAALVSFCTSALSPTNSMAATVQNSGDKAAIIIVAEGAARRDYSVDPQKQISFCLKGCFITLANGDRYALNGSEAIEISGNRISFH
ncbi:hypothetical protein N5853_09530 [Bartonella sp. HY329]|uniref:hypothetical protein n=1 Tax=unclassified Bartonella TaxID=2645622 RepID=UPI0021C7F285|nr:MULTISPECIES: hypothetical protein [unclassified Bartonella]UXM94348.1 hypothetical protein N5853_09530 [Bartonella sp. HY329]UXN08671.1 hypothetical protein N5852_09540 [Bartonella sp. HY328]